MGLDDRSCFTKRSCLFEQSRGGHTTHYKYIGLSINRKLCELLNLCAWTRTSTLLQQPEHRGAKRKKIHLEDVLRIAKEKGYHRNANDPKNFVVAPKKKKINSVRSNIRIFSLPYLSTKVSRPTPLFLECCCVRMSQRRNLLRVSGPIFSVELVIQATQSHQARPCV